MSSSDSFKEVQRAHKYLQAFQRAHYGPFKVIAVTPCTFACLSCLEISFCLVVSTMHQENQLAFRPMYYWLSAENTDMYEVIFKELVGKLGPKCDIFDLKLSLSCSKLLRHNHIMIE